MKAIAIITVTLTLFGISLADEDKKTRILNFYKCVSCAEDPTVREEYLKCAELKPEKCKKMADECKVKLMADASTIEERWDLMCKNEDGIAEKFYDCVMNDENRKNLDDEEKDKLKEFVQCSKKVAKKYCDSH